MPGVVATGFSVFDWAPSPMLAVFWRELLTTLRQFRIGFLLLVMGALLLLRTMLTLAALAADALRPSAAIHGALMLQCSALLLVVFFVVPALAAVTLAAERQQNTEDLLSTALLGPASLATGKLLAVLAVFALFHTALLPFGAFIYFFAGIEVRSLFQVGFLLYTTAFFHAVIGMAASRAIGAVNHAVFAAYALMALIYALPAALHQGELARTSAAVAPAAPPNPLSLLPDLLIGTAGWRACADLALYQGVGAALVALLLLASIRLIRPGALVRLQRGGNGDTRSRSCGPIPDWGLPIFHKDRRAARLGHPAWALSAFAATTLLAAAFNHWSARELNWSVTAIDAGVIVLYLLIPFMVIERCAREMDPDTLVHLRMSLVGSDRVLMGKALAVLCHLAPVILGIVAGTALPLAILGHEVFTADLRDPPSIPQLAYKALMLGPKSVIAIGICFMCTRFRAPGAADLAVNLVLSALLLALSESVSRGLFESVASPHLGAFQTAVIVIGHLIAAGCAAAIVYGVAQTRFEIVFDEGGDLYAVSHVDRRDF